MSQFKRMHVQQQGDMKYVTTHFVMLVKDTLKEEVSIVVQLGGAVRRNLYPEKKRRKLIYNKRLINWIKKILIWYYQFY